MKIADKLMRGATESQYRDADWNRICRDNEWTADPGAAIA